LTVVESGTFGSVNPRTDRVDWSHYEAIVRVEGRHRHVDHEVVDGAPAARFARRLGELVEQADGLTG
jgi:hypothetical protein